MSRNFLIDAYMKLRQRLQHGLLDAGDDALNDAFCQLWAGRYDPETKEEGEKLLYSTLRNRQISLWRKDRRHPQTLLANTQIAEPPPDTDAEDMYRLVQRLVETQLTPLQQDILMHHDINGETYSEIAQRLGMQEAAVRMQLSRARKKIREVYKLKVEDPSPSPPRGRV